MDEKAGGEVPENVNLAGESGESGESGVPEELIARPAAETAPAAPPEPLPESPPAPIPSPAPPGAPIPSAVPVAVSPVAPRVPAAAPPTQAPPPRSDRGSGLRPDLSELREPLYREAGGYKLRMDPRDLARLRELPGSKEKTDRELGERFFDAQAARLAEALAGDVATPEEVRVVVDPYSRQAFLAVGKTIRGIVSF